MNESSDKHENKPKVLMDDLESEQRIKLLNLGEIIEYEADQFIIKEGDTADCIFIVQSGNVEISKEGITLANKLPGEEIGAMAMIEGTPRSADAIAKGKTVCVKVKYDKLIDDQNLYGLITTHLLGSQIHDLKRMNDVAISTTKKKLSILEERMEGSRFFINIVIVLIIYQVVLGILIDYNAITNFKWFNLLIGPMTILALGVFMGFLAYKSKRSWRDYGLCWGNWKKEIPQALLWSGAFCTFIIGIKSVLTFIPNSPFYGEAVLSKQQIWNLDTPKFLTFIASYTLLVPIQEFSTRGVLQTEFKRIFDGDFSRHYAIFLASGIFSAFHIVLNIQFAILTFIPGLFWGYLFDKQESLLGVSLSHLIIGLFGILYIMSA